MTLRWGVVAALFVGVAVWGSWVVGLWGSTPPPADEAHPVTAAPAARPKLEPVRTAAWMLANAQPKPLDRRSDGLPDPAGDAGCGKSAEPCPDDALCIHGDCVSALCNADGGAGARCAMLLQNGVIGLCCGTLCSDVTRDPDHCGQCGVRCPQGLDCIGGNCEARSCTGRMAGTACANGDRGTGACCRGGCVDQATWANDPANCGGCAHACAPGLACAKGLCVDAATGGQPSWTCADKGHECPTGSFCVIDACFPRACTGDNDGLLCAGAAGGELGHCCGQVCTDLFEDKDNCRACGTHCGPGETCKNGECAPAAP